MESHDGKTGRRRKAAWPRPDAARVQAARERLREAGLTVVAWAAANGENESQVHKVLSGRRSCVYGEAARIAVKLGIKDPAPAVVSHG